ncbi:major facilitator superfamily domain-containing protein [Nemania abortiva]|nr:major facilitator superfamily domain-containing protein [Nemania abortiva]
MNACAGVAAALGPALGGVIASRNWRWIFYLNIPICGVALGIVLIFMRMKTGNKEDIRWKGQIARMDWIGNLIFTPSMIAILFGLVMGGTQFSWSSWHILVPLIVGAFGWVAFHTWEHFCINPSIPSRLFRNRTSAAAYALTFISSITVQAQSYFIPLYFQAALGNTILEAGTNFLPFAIGTLGSAAISGILLSKFGAYRRLHGVSFALSAIGFGLLTLLDGHTPKVGWVFIELVASAGSGSIISVLLPAIMAALSEDDVAAASAAFAFTKTFGYTWGVTIASIIFNSTFDRNLYLINSPELRRELKNGGAYGFASQVHLRHDLSVDTRRGLVLAYTRSLRAIWWFGLAISLVGFLVTGLERKLELRKTLDTAYGLDGADGKEKPSPEVTDSIEASITQKEGA